MKAAKLLDDLKAVQYYIGSEDYQLAYQNLSCLISELQAESKKLDDDKRFKAHLDECRETVRKWPEWKQAILGGKPITND